MSRIRIISGSLGRRTLSVPEGDMTRPTSNRVREAIFNMLEARNALSGALVLDLFSGTGALGIEALSRGASRAVFVDNKPVVLACSEENAEVLGVSDQCHFVRSDAFEFLRRPTESQYHLILADPPYALSGQENLPDLARRHLSPGGYFVLEHDRHVDLSTKAGLVMSKSYGRTSVSLFQQNGANE